MAAIVLGDTFANDLAKLIFTATPITSIAINATVSPFTSLYLSLHTADPGSTGNQTTNEISYTGYSRQALVRTASGWTVSANAVSPLAAVVFGLMTAGTGGLARYAMVGTASTGTGKQLIRGTLFPSIVCQVGINPSIGTGSAITFGTLAIPPTDLSVIGHWRGAAFAAGFPTSLHNYEAWLSNPSQSVEVTEGLFYLDTWSGHTSGNASWSGWDATATARFNDCYTELLTLPNRRYRCGLPMLHSHTDWDNLLAGNHDSHFTLVNDLIVAKEVTQPGSAARFAIRIGWEPNHVGYPWGARTSPTYSGSTWSRLKYRQGWRRIAGLFAGARALGTRLVWNPDTPQKSVSWVNLWPGMDDSGETGAPEIPGFDLVDVVGCDAYDKDNGGSSQTPTWRWGASYAGPNGISDLIDHATAKGGLPVSFDEWGVVVSPVPSSITAGDDPYFIQQIALVMQGLIDLDRFDGHCYWESTFGVNAKLSTAVAAPNCQAAFKAIWGGP